MDSAYGTGDAVRVVVVACDHDTTIWGPCIAFKILGSAPSGPPICHFMPCAFWLGIQGRQAVMELETDSNKVLNLRGKMMFALHTQCIGGKAKDVVSIRHCISSSGQCTLTVSFPASCSVGSPLAGRRSGRAPPLLGPREPLAWRAAWPAREPCALLGLCFLLALCLQRSKNLQ